MRTTFVLLLALAHPVSAQEERTITVTGTGSVVVKADAARVTFGVRTVGPDFRAVRDENAKASKVLLDGVEGLKLGDVKVTPLALDTALIDTSNARAAVIRLGAVNPVNPAGPEITHNVTQLYTLILRNPKPDVLRQDAEAVLAAVVERGANASSPRTSLTRASVSSILSTSGERPATVTYFKGDDSAAQRDAVKKAVADAVAKAEAIAEAIDPMAKVKVVSVTDGAGGTRVIDADGYVYSSGADPVGGSSPEISVTVRVQVKCKY